jgi:hypothetical protein
MKKVIRLNEEDITNLVNRVITELSPSIKNRSALAANKYKDETGSFAARRRSQKDSFLELPNSLNIMADNIARKMEQYFDGLTLMSRFESGYHRTKPLEVINVECSLNKMLDSNSNILIILEYKINFKITEIDGYGNSSHTGKRKEIIHKYYVTNEDGNINEEEESFIDLFKLKFFVGSDNQSIRMEHEHNGITPRDIIQMLIRLHKKLKTEVSI